MFIKIFLLFFLVKLTIQNNITNIDNVKDINIDLENSSYIDPFTMFILENVNSIFKINNLFIDIDNKNLNELNSTLYKISYKKKAIIMKEYIFKESTKNIFLEVINTPLDINIHMTIEQNSEVSIVNLLIRKEICNIKCILYTCFIRIYEDFIFYKCSNNNSIFDKTIIIKKNPESKQNDYSNKIIYVNNNSKNAQINLENIFKKTNEINTNNTTANVCNEGQNSTTMGGLGNTFMN